MKTPRSAMVKVIAKKAKSENPKQLAKDIAQYLLAEKRVGDLDSLMRDIQQFRADTGDIEVSALSAHTLSEQSIKEIKSVIKNHYPAAKSIQINQVVDPSVVGGIRLIFANEQLDLSIRYKLSKFKQLTAI